MRRPVLMPRLAEEVDQGVVVTWFVEPGARIREGELLAELQVEKVSSELRAPCDGRVVELLVVPGGVVTQGDPIAIIEEATGGAAAPDAGGGTPAPAPLPAGGGGGVAASPSARRLARELGVDLAGVSGSGPGGRIVEADIRTAAAGPARATPISPMRRAIAERLQTWLGSTAQVTLMAEADVTDLVAELGRRARDDPLQGSLVAAAVRAVALALRDHPRVGARWTEAGLRESDRRDIGVAVARVDGLVTPVVRDADRKDLPTLGREIAAAAERARAGELTPAEVEGGVLSVTNLGAYRIDGFTPLLNPPQSAILGLGRARWRPAVRDGAVVPRQLMVLSLTFDHRVVDGAPAASFLTDVVERLETPAALVA